MSVDLESSDKPITKKQVISTKKKLDKQAAQTTVEELTGSTRFLPTYPMLFSEELTVDTPKNEADKVDEADQIDEANAAGEHDEVVEDNADDEHDEVDEVAEVDEVDEANAGDEHDEVDEANADDEHDAVNEVAEVDEAGEADENDRANQANTTDGSGLVQQDTKDSVPKSQEVLLKKKRGRKPKLRTVNDVIKIPKKRGRKPKIKIIDESVISLTDSTQSIKKRGKSKNTYSLIDNDATQAPVSNINVFDNQSYIITLKITSDELTKEMLVAESSEIDKQMSVPIKIPRPNNSDQINGIDCQSSEQCCDGNITFRNSATDSTHSTHSTISKELACYMEQHFNNMYSSQIGTIPNNYSLAIPMTMPRVSPENADFNLETYNSFIASTQNVSSNNRNEGIQNGGATSVLVGGDLRSPPTFSESLHGNKTPYLTKIDLGTQILGQWINRRVEYILPAFKDKDQTWPEQSPYACWNCTEMFDGPPIGIPDHIEGKIDAMDVDDMKFYLYGNFCNFHCAARYLFDTVKDSSVWEKYSWLNVLHAKVYGLKQIIKVEPSPVRILLKKFGGTLSIEKYRHSHLGNLQYQIFKPPMIPILFQMEESLSDRVVQKSKQQIIPMDVEKVERKLKLKRLKPAEGNTLTIDKCMNMQVKVI